MVKERINIQTTIQAIVNQKGGVGKSFSCINIGVGLARAGKKVLLVDFDPQASMTMIFDEVDTGVSGKTSQKIGMKLKQLGKTGCQVICVTHSAQIAALADAHLYISKHEIDGRKRPSRRSTAQDVSARSPASSAALRSPIPSAKRQKNCL